jgi:hypothetical protein
MIIKPRFFLKAPIKGVQFSNQEVGLELEYEVSNDDWEEVYSTLIKQLKLVANEYKEKLEAEIEDTQTGVMEKLQVELARTYEDKLKKASEEIYKLRDLLKDNGISYK